MQHVTSQYSQPPSSYTLVFLTGYTHSGRPIVDVHICDSAGNTVHSYPHSDRPNSPSLSRRIALAEFWIEESSWWNEDA